MTQVEALKMIERRREERRKKNLIKKKIRKILFHIFAILILNAAMIFAIIYSIDNMTVYR